MPLCAYCLKIRPPHHSRPKDDENGNPQRNHECIIRHHENFAALLESADNGCELCMLFRPFIEHAQLRRQGLVSIAKSDCSDTDGSGYTHEDPFMTEVGDSSDSELESGSGYATDYDDEASIHESEPGSGSESDSVEEPEANHEILKWLLLSKTYATGPEQLWISGSLKDHDHVKGSATQSQESMSMISLGAGSLQGREFFEGNSYCLDGEWLENQRALAIKAPGLWKWHHDPLKIRAGIKRPRRALRPNFELFQHRDNALELDPPVRGRDIAKDANSEKALAVVQDWWSDCKTSHVTCSSGWESEAQLPTRVIDLGPQSEPLRPRLYHTKSDEEIKGRNYATFSHCWGANPSAITKTLKANIKDMQQGMDIEKLSRNFKDAILIARGLKIRYIWIDAICIIQDSAEDWDHEAGQMAKYYRNASVMISALTSPGADQGLLHPRLSDKQAVQLSTSQGRVFVRPILEDVVSLARSSGISSFGALRPQLEDTPLSERGWTLQERVLSQRIIHYSKQQMIWQCKTCLLSEDGEYSTSEKTRTDGTLIDLMNLDSKMENPTPNRLRWNRLVAEFTRRRLTFDVDKLPALSGIASEIARVTGDTYVAGLWKNRIGHELLWDICRDDEDSVRSVARINNGSPTWSWASIRGGVTHNLIGFKRVPREYDPRDLKIGWKAATSDPFGRVSGAIILVSMVCHSYVGPKTFSKKRKVVRLEERIATSDNSGSQSESSLSENVSAPDLEYLLESETLDIFNDQYDWDSETHIIACLGEYNYDWSSSTPEWVDSTNKWGQQEFLLLRKRAKGPNDKIRYERVGRASTDSKKRLPIVEAKGWIRQNIALV